MTHFGGFAAIGRISFAMFGVLIVTSGCLISPAPVTLRVDPAVIEDVRAIGKVRAEFDDESDLEDGGTQISRELIIDVGAARGREALDKASELLTARQWVIKGQNRPTIVMMSTARWKDTYLALRPYNPAYFENYPNVLERLKKESADESSLVYLDVSRGSIE